MIRKKRLIICSVALAVVIALAAFCAFVPIKRLLPAYDIPARGEGELRLHFLDVGQGDCTLVEFPSGKVLVIDAGDGTFRANNRLVRYLKGLRPTSLILLLTHADSDHYGGFESIVETFGAEKIYLPVLDSNASSYRALLSAVEKRDIQTETLVRYGVIEESGAYLKCLSPYSVGETDGNDASAVLYLDYGGISAVFCADISTTRERRLAREYLLDETLFDGASTPVRLGGVEILKLGHHGSADSSSEEWLSLLCPKTAVVSCGRGNSYAHPAGEALARLKSASPTAEIYRTDELGDIVVAIANGNYTVYTE